MSETKKDYVQPVRNGKFSKDIELDQLYNFVEAENTYVLLRLTDRHE